LAALNGRAGLVSDAEVSQRFAASAIVNTSVADLREHLEYWEARNPNDEFRETAGRDSRTELDSHVLTSSGDLGLISIEVEPEAPNRIERLLIGEPQE
jgi:hypothetical protein